MRDDPPSSAGPTLPQSSVDVSIVLCTYNGARWLGDLLHSMSSQTRQADELVIQDDRSTDATTEIVEEFARSAPFEVRLEVNERRLGSTANFATALTRSRGRFVALADQDDIWYRTKLERLVGELELDPTITMVFSDADLIDESGRPLGRHLWDTRMIGRTLRRRAVVPEAMFARRALTTGCTIAVRRRAVAAALPFPAELADETAPMRHDRWLSLVAAAVGTVRALPEPLLGFRVHPAQETGVLVGGRLTRALARAAVGAVVDPGTDRGHVTRAVQLDVAADRADELGDFEEAAVLRGIAEHHRRRALPEPSALDRLRVIGDDVRSGFYGWDRLGVGAVAGDVVRAVRGPGN